ncbi:fasciclin domain-containing protein [Nostocoides australiense]
MKRRQMATGICVLALASAPAASASAAGESSLGNRSLAAVLTSDGNTFDSNWYDYDIVTEAALAVLKAKPNSPVKVLADGNTRVTAFIPADRAFQVLVKDLTGKTVRSEKGVFNVVASLGIDAIESVLLYHVVPGATITSGMAVKSNGVKLSSAQGGKIEVRVWNVWVPIVQLKDADKNDVDPFINPRGLDINKGNKQIAHGITLVLRPADL